MANRKAIDPADCTRYPCPFADDPEVLLQQEDDEYEAYQRALQGTPEYWSELCEPNLILGHPHYVCSDHQGMWTRYLISGTINS